MKTCTKCGEVKSLDCFPKRNGGRRNQCKGCVNNAARQRHAEDPSKYKPLRQAWTEANRSRFAAYSVTWRGRNPGAANAQTRVRRARLAAAVIGPVDEQVLHAMYPDCYLCGHQLGPEADLDHVVPVSRGGAHSMRNLRPTHPICNRRKYNSHLSELHWYDGPKDLGEASRAICAPTVRTQ